MYNRLIVFIVVLVMFSLQSPGDRPFLPPMETALSVAAIFAGFLLLCHVLFRSLERAISTGGVSSRITRRYFSLQARLSVSSILCIAFYVFGLDIKFYLSNFIFHNYSETLTGLSGLLLYFAHEAVIQLRAYKIHRAIFGSNLSRSAFVRSYFSFSAAILIPWLLLSLVSDTLRSFHSPVFFTTETGQWTALLATLGLFVLFAPWLIVRLWGCRPLPESELSEELKRFCTEQKFPVGGLMLWPLMGGETLTAGIIGILPRFRYILFTQSILSLLNVEELKAVIAHEMGHVRRLHIPFFLIFFLGWSAVAYALNDFFLLFLMKVFASLGLFLSPETRNLTRFSLAYGIPVLLLLVCYFRFIFGYFLRNAERQADLYALQLVGNPYTLISSFQKIAFAGGKIEDLPSWHHFSIRQRMDTLMDAFQNPAFMRRHNLKLYGSTLAFLLVAGGLFLAAPSLYQAPFAQEWRKEITESVIRNRLQENPDNPEMLGLYGGLLFELGKTAEAETAMRKALDLAPLQADVLNNLAWLYAVSPPPWFQPSKALDLARAAASLKPEPHVLDTLAEAFFVNGFYREAVSTIDTALAMNPPNPKYYLDQKKKFEESIDHDASPNGIVGQ